MGEPWLVTSTTSLTCELGTPQNESYRQKLTGSWPTADYTSQDKHPVALPPTSTASCYWPFVSHSVEQQILASGVM
jgi:hypothetical protein